MVNTKAKLSTTDQPQIDDQNKSANQNPDNLLQSLVQKNLGNWDLIPPIVQIAYNDPVTWSLGLKPFEIILGCEPLKPLDLILMHPHACVFISVEVVVSHFHSLHIEINKQFEASKALYKPQVDWHKQYFEFNIGDYVILQACNAGLFKISKHVGQNAYVNDLLSHYDHHPILFVTDFNAYTVILAPLMTRFYSRMRIPTLNLLPCLLQSHLSQHKKIKLMLFWMNSLC